MSYKAIAKYIPYSPYKLRPLADVIRNKSVEFALQWLFTYRNQRTVPLKKIIESALANARNLKCDTSAHDLLITEIKVDQGPIRKYFKPGAQGRATFLRRRFCHIQVILNAKENKHMAKGVISGTKG
jgi:large subunit ribosomal protein L22